MAGRSRMAKGIRMFKMAQLDKVTEMVAVFKKAKLTKKAELLKFAKIGQDGQNVPNGSKGHVEQFDPNHRNGQ